jgi:hypothetical protein
MINAAQKIREAAGAEFACAIIAGLIQIGGGILAARGSMKAMDVGLKPYNIGAPKAAVPGAAGTTTPSAATPGATGTPGAWQKATNPSIASQAGGPGAPPASPPPRVQIGSERVAPAPAAKPNPGGLEAAPKQVARPDGPLQADAVTTTGRTRSNAVSGDQHRPQQQQQQQPGAADGPEISPQQRTAIDKANIEAQAIQGKWNAVLQIAMGASAMANATGGLASKLIEADKAVLDADAKQWGYKVDDAKDSQERFHQLKDEMQRMFGEIGRSEYEMNKQIWS